MSLVIPSGLSARARTFLGRAARRSVGNPDRAPAMAPALVRAREKLRREVDGLEVRELLLGITLRWTGQQAVVTVDRVPMVLVGLRWYREPVWLDEAGRLFWRDGFRPDDPVLLRAASARLLLERIALGDALLRLPLVVELDQRLGARLAKAVGLTPIGEASGPDAGWWGRPDAGGLTLIDGRVDAPDRPCATLLGRPPELAAALRVARALAPDAAAHVHSRHPLDRAAHVARFTLRPPEEAPPAPPLSDTVMPLRGPADMRGAGAGVLDVMGDHLRVVETHAGRVLIERTFFVEPSGAVAKDEQRYLHAAARVAPHVTEAARACMALVEIAFDPRVPLPRDEARTRLVAAGVADPERLLALEDALGGLVIGEDLHGLHLGLAVALPPSGVIARDASGRVRFGRWSDGLVHADEAGRVHFEDPIDGTDHLLAEDAAHFLERELRRYEPAGVGPRLELDALVGAALAEALGLTLVPALSDAARRHWRGPAGAIEEGPERMGAVATRVELTLEALRAVAPALARLPAAVTGCSADAAPLLAEAGLDVSGAGRGR